ncbi:MAG: DUF3791 domain-containing protein [Duncaniella sp.]|nr:DUF3791 domain-containing protein [Duncaniella sp.]
MTEESKTVIRSSKVARIIMSLCELYGITLMEATDIFYTSDISDMIEEGVSDLQCRSEKYLATLIWDEYHEKLMK